MDMKINPKFKPILLEALQDLMYKTALELEDLKGQPLTKIRKELSQKQAQVEELQHYIYNLEE